MTLLGGGGVTLKNSYYDRSPARSMRIATESKPKPCKLD